MRRLKGRKSLSVLVGGVFAAVLGGTALALVIVAMTASVSSNEFAGAPGSSGESLALAITNGQEIVDCTNLAPFSTSDVDLGPVSFDLNEPNALQDTNKFLCVKNNGTTPLAQVSFTSNVTASNELGCSPAEGLVDPEGASCGSAGELGDVVLFVFNSHRGENQGGCGGTAILPGQENLMQLGSDLLPGETCMLKIQMVMASGATNEQKAAASSDTAEFSFDVAGS